MSCVQSKRKTKSLPPRHHIRFAERVAAYPERVRKQIAALRMARDEAVRKARNCVFYATAPGDISERGRQMWLEGARELVREARELNKKVRLVK